MAVAVSQAVTACMVRSNISVFIMDTPLVWIKNDPMTSPKSMFSWPIGNFLASISLIMGSITLETACTYFPLFRRPPTLKRSLFSTLLDLHLKIDLRYKLLEEAFCKCHHLCVNVSFVVLANNHIGHLPLVFFRFCFFIDHEGIN